MSKTRLRVKTKKLFRLSLPLFRILSVFARVSAFWTLGYHDRGVQTMTPSSDNQSVTAIADRLDEVATTMERRWGIGRLPLLVDPDLRLRFDRQREKLNQAVAADNPDIIKRLFSRLLLERRLMVE